MSGTYSHIMERRSPKSPFPRSPMLKSPFPRSPIPQSPELYEKYKSKCAYGLINIFHFRHSHSKKLISDKAVLKRHAGELKKIAEEDMPIKQQIKKTTAKVEHVQSDSELAGDPSTSRRKAIKATRKPRRLPIYGCYDVATMGNAKSVHENSVDDSSKKMESAVTKESLSNQAQPKNKINFDCRSVQHGKHGQSKEINLEVRMNEATEAFINQKLIDGKHLSTDGEDDQSKYFMDALETLNSNKDLFIKLLQDPNSLLVKHIEDLRDSQEKMQQIKSYPEDKLSEQHKNNSRECERTVCTRNFNSIDGSLSKGIGDPQPLETIVVLRTGSASLQNCADGIGHDSQPVHYRLKNVQQSVKPSFFPFVQMKRKLMHAMRLSRKERQLMLIDGSVQKSKYIFQESEKCGGGGMDINERNSPGETSSYFGRTTMDVRGKDQMEIIESSVREEAGTASEKGHESSGFSNLRHSKETNNDKYVEKRVHLSDFLMNENVNLSRKQRPKTWDGMNSLPENEFFPMVSPRYQAEHARVTPQMRFSLYGSYEMVNKNKWNQSEKRNNTSPTRQNLEARPWGTDKKCEDQLQIIETEKIISDKLFPDVKADENISSLENDSSPRGFTKIIGKRDIKISEEYSPSCVPSRLDGSYHSDANESTCTKNTTDERESSKFFRPDSSAENQMSPSSTSDYLPSPSTIQRVEDLDKARERAEQPSPVSVLEQFFTEDMITRPPSHASRPAELSTLPLRIGNEEDYLAALVHSPLDVKINLEYISAVLRASGFNLDDLSSKCNGESCDGHKFICDYFVEVLLEVYQNYMRSSPWLSFAEPKVRPVTMAENMIQQVMKHVDRNMLLQPPSLALDHLVEKDLTNSATWLDVRIDVEYVVSMIVESVLEEVIMETAIE
ncbi:hypothetical protein SADUNF_Sadunf01G0081500 [Salix dunnii]|uniref:DUF4378 domain-containing protein n=1 Tax=Salix dunnii TaxID=1413687 RepID=A0A835NAP3_9ROSI|nr:hypothetical protein SADUNF_Sadunf01G0081500 [Salix dunnii]